MKNILMGIFIPIFLILFYPAEALVAGDMISFNFSSCDDLIVNITPFEENEWEVENCIEETIGNFYCDCDDNYQLNLTPAKNSVGNFTIYMTSYYEGIKQETISQISIGGGGFVQPSEEETEVECEEDWTCSEWSECLEGTQTRTCDDVNNCGTYNNQPLLSQSCSIEETPPLGPTGFFLLSPTDWILGIIIGIIIVIFTILLLKRRKKFVMSP